MSSREMAMIVLRPRRRALLFLAAAAILATAGCGHRRSSLRPVYTSPGGSAAPCTNCGSGASVSGGEVITTPSRSGGALPSEPSNLDPVEGSESTVPSLNGPSSSSGSVSRRYTPSERAPSASIGGDPDLDILSPSKSSPARTPSSSSTRSKSPVIQGPNGSSPTSWNTEQGDRRASTAPVGRVRQVSFQERLRPYLDESEGNELFYPSKADRPWKYVVLHHSAHATGGYDEIDGEHRKVLGYDGCGYHFVIGNGTGSGDGQIEIAQRWVKQKHGVHCRNAKSSEIDEYGIGICFVGDLDRNPPTPRQVAAAKALIAYLETRYAIPQERVETHAHIAATPTACPGKFFPSRSVMAPAGQSPSTARIVPSASRIARTIPESNAY